MRKPKKKKIKTFDIFIIVTSFILTLVFIIVFAILNLQKDKDTLPAANTSAMTESAISSNESSSQDEAITQSGGNSDPKPNSPTQSNTTSSREIVSVSSFTEQDTKILDDIMKKHGEGVSAFFLDIDSNNTYAYNENERYFIASVIKAPFAMYIYTLADEGKCDLSTKITMEEKIKQTGMGKLKDMEAPMDFTISELIHYAIVESDNTAMKMLVKHFPYTGYIEFAKGIGIQNIEDIKHVDDGIICAKDAAVYAKAIYDFIETNQYGADLKKDMMSTGNPMIRSKYPIARKYGWAEKSLHDMAIVYAPHPYVLAICTNKDEGTAQDMSLFTELTKALEKIQAEKYNDAN